VLNSYVRNHNIQTVIDLGCGDGNQLTLAKYPTYHGLDVSPTVLEQCRTRFANDATKRFSLYDPETFDPSAPANSAELALSLDVIYHLLEDDTYDAYMRHLFAAAKKYVIIYSNDTDHTPPHLSSHIRFREFSDWVMEHAPNWKLIDHIENPYPLQDSPGDESFCDFFIYERQDSMTESQNHAAFSSSGAVRPTQTEHASLSISGLDGPVHFAHTSFSEPYIA